jgi:hypothetical protein
MGVFLMGGVYVVCSFSLAAFSRLLAYSLLLVYSVLPDGYFLDGCFFVVQEASSCQDSNFYKAEPFKNSTFHLFSNYIETTATTSKWPRVMYLAPSFQKVLSCSRA